MRGVCANDLCGVTLISGSAWRTRSPEARKGVSRHVGYGLCQGCYNRFKRRGTTTYAKPQRAPRPVKPATPCAGSCGRQLLTREGLRVVPEDQRVGLALHAARGLCQRCWRKAKANDTLLDLPAKKRMNDEVMEEWELLRTQGVHSIRKAAERMGMTHKALEKAIQRGRERGDSRAILPHTNLRSAS